MMPKKNEDFYEKQEVLCPHCDLIFDIKEGVMELRILREQMAKNVKDGREYLNR